MKLCAVLLVAVSVAFVCVDGQKGGLGDLLKQCGDESGVSMEDMKTSMMNGNSDGKLNCPVTCMCKKIKIMNADGSPNKAGVDALLSQMPEKMKPMKAIIEECIKSMEASADKCKSGGDFAKCAIPKLMKLKH